MIAQLVEAAVNRRMAEAEASRRSSTPFVGTVGPSTASASVSTSSSRPAKPLPAGRKVPPTATSGERPKVVVTLGDEDAPMEHDPQSTPSGSSRSSESIDSDDSKGKEVDDDEDSGETGKKTAEVGLFLLICSFVFHFDIYPVFNVPVF